MSYLVAVSAPVGGGKSSLVSGLSERMSDAAAIYFDSYETLTRRPIEEIRRWMEAGADIQDLVIPGLPEDIDRLRGGKAVVDPLTGREVAPAKYILFETPFARLHAATGAHIDLAIWIDTPLDVALARNIRELTDRPEMQRDFVPWLRAYLDSYLRVVHDLLRMQQEGVGAAADLVLDGQEPLDTNRRRAEEEILSRLP